MFNAVGKIVNGADMDTILNTLILIHREFYNLVHEMDATKVTHSTGEVINHIRSSVLKGRMIFFDGSLHDELANPINHELHEKVRQLGGKIADVLSESVSHIVSKGDKTDLTMNYTKYPQYKFVSESWIYACFTFMGPMSSKNYPVRGIEGFSNESTASTTSSVTSNSVVPSISPASSPIPPVTTSTPPAMDPDLEDLLSDNTESDCSPPGETIPDESSRLKRTNRDRDRDRGKDVNKELSEEQKREKRKRTLLD